MRAKTANELVAMIEGEWDICGEAPEDTIEALIMAAALSHDVKEAVDLAVKQKSHQIAKDLAGDDGEHIGDSLQVQPAKRQSGGRQFMIRADVDALQDAIGFAPNIYDFEKPSPDRKCDAAWSVIDVTGRQLSIWTHREPGSVCRLWSARGSRDLAFDLFGVNAILTRQEVATAIAVAVV